MYGNLQFKLKVPNKLTLVDKVIALQNTQPKTSERYRWSWKSQLVYKSRRSDCCKESLHSVVDKKLHYSNPIKEFIINYQKISTSWYFICFQRNTFRIQIPTVVIIELKRIKNYTYKRLVTLRNCTFFSYYLV